MGVCVVRTHVRTCACVRMCVRVRCVRGGGGTAIAVCLRHSSSGTKLPLLSCNRLRHQVLLRLTTPGFIPPTHPRARSVSKAAHAHASECEHEKHTARANNRDRQTQVHAGRGRRHTRASMRTRPQIPPDSDRRLRKGADPFSHAHAHVHGGGYIRRRRAWHPTSRVRTPAPHVAEQTDQTAAIYVYVSQSTLIAHGSCRGNAQCAHAVGSGLCVVLKWCRHVGRSGRQGVR